MTGEEFMVEYKEKSAVLLRATLSLAETVKKIDTLEEMNEEDGERLLIEMEFVSRKMKRQIETVVEDI